MYCWAIRHPASGYVQGINDLVTPFFQVFLTSYLPADEIERLRSFAPAATMAPAGGAGEETASPPQAAPPPLLTRTALAQVEADAFWCLSKLLDGIQDNYTHGQPGIQRQVAKLRELIGRIDGGSLVFSLS